MTESEYLSQKRQFSIVRSNLADGITTPDGKPIKTNLNSTPSKQPVVMTEENAPDIMERFQKLTSGPLRIK